MGAFKNRTSGINLAYRQHFCSVSSSTLLLLSCSGPPLRIGGSDDLVVQMVSTAGHLLFPRGPTLVFSLRVHWCAFPRTCHRYRTLPVLDPVLLALPPERTGSLHAKRARTLQSCRMAVVLSAASSALPLSLFHPCHGSLCPAVVGRSERPSVGVWCSRPSMSMSLAHVGASMAHQRLGPPLPCVQPLHPSFHGSIHHW